MAPMQDAPAPEINGSSDAFEFCARVEARPAPRRARTRRRSLRRAVAVECDLHSNVWDGTVALEATDISNEGLWIETPYALSEGEELVVSFDLPGARENGRFWAVAEVARVGLFRRQSDEQPSGMGLVFTYFCEADRLRLRAALQGRPPPLPACVRRISVPPPLPKPASAESDLRAQDSDAAALDDQALPAVLDWLLASE
jgi:PilZ domain